MDCLDHDSGQWQGLNDAPEFQGLVNMWNTTLQQAGQRQSKGEGEGSPDGAQGAQAQCTFHPLPAMRIKAGSVIHPQDILEPSVCFAAHKGLTVDKQYHICSIMRKYRIDILCFQETRTSRADYFSIVVFILYYLGQVKQASVGQVLALL